MWRLIAADFKAARPPLSLRPSMVSAGVAPGLDRHCRGRYANPTPTDPLTSNGVLTPLTENGRVDSYVYKKLSTGTPPAGPRVSTAKGNPTITATDGAKPTNFGGVYGHTLTVSESGSNDLGTIAAADPTGLLVATPDEGDPNLLRVREYKGY